MDHQTMAYFSQAYEKYADMLYRICLLSLKNKQDAEEAVSDTFLKLMESRPCFESPDHEKAWLIRVAVNLCKNQLTCGWARRVVHNEEVLMYLKTPEEQSLMEEILQLSPKYRVVLYMYYYEGYKTHEIAGILHLRDSSVRSRLARGRKLLKDILLEGGFSYG